MSQTKAQLIDTLVASLLPASDSAVDIGSNAVRFANIYGDTLYGSGANLTGLNIVTDTSPQLGGNLDVNTKNILFGDSVNTNDDRLKFGAGEDLQIYHDGTISRVQDDTNHLYVKGVNITLFKGNSAEKFIDCITDGAVELYHDNSKKLNTNTNGVHITDTLTFANTGDSVLLADNQKVSCGNGGDLKIYHDGGNSIIRESGTGSLFIESNTNIFLGKESGAETYIKGVPDGAVELYFDNSKKFETTSIGVKVSANSSVDGLLVTAPSEGTVTVADERGASFKASFLMAGSAPVIRNQNTSTSDSTLVIQKGSSTVAQWDGNGHYLPGANNTYDIGSTSLRWRNIYTNDLNLSNEGGANDVDGTWGSYTIQEGAEDLFLVNKRSGKKYKFNLTEVK